MKAASILIAAGVIVLMMAGFMSALNSFMVKTQTDPYTVTTAAGVTSANVTLSQDLYAGATSRVTVSSTDTTDNPIAWTYTTATRVLLVTGLEANTSRTLTIAYDIDNLTVFWGAGVTAKVIPTLLLLGVLSIVAGGVRSAFTHGE